MKEYVIYSKTKNKLGILIIFKSQDSAIIVEENKIHWIGDIDMVSKINIIGEL